MYDEVIVVFNTMNEVGSRFSVEIYNFLIYIFVRGGFYKEVDVIWIRMGEFGVLRNRDLFNGVIEGFR